MMRPKNPFPPEVRRLKALQMRTIINEIRKILWFDDAGNPAPDQQPPPGTVKFIMVLLVEHGLKPEPPKDTGTDV